MEICKKKSISQCKIDIFCFFGGSRKCISHKFAPGVEIFIAGKWKICKQSPFYTVKWRFFCIFGGSRKCISHKFAPGVEIFIAAEWKICKKNTFYSVKWIFFAFQKMHIPQVCPRGRDIRFWEMENMPKKISILHCKMEIFCIFGGSRKCISQSLPQNRYPFLGNGKYDKNLHFTL